METELAFFRSLPLDWLIKLGMAVACGSLIGIERQLRRKAAGMRTNVLICLGSTLYVMAAELMLSQHGLAGYDPTRIAGQVVVGMGFIGAGSIIQSRGKIQGLTSAATLWVVAAIGVVIGIGYPLLALVVTLLVIFLLVVVGRFEFLVLGKCKTATVRISFTDQPATWERLRHVFESYDHKLDPQTIVHTQSTAGKTICLYDVAYCHVHPDHAEFLLEILRIPDVRQTTYRPGT